MFTAALGAVSAFAGGTSPTATSDQILLGDFDTGGISFGEQPPSPLVGYGNIALVGAVALALIVVLAKPKR